MPEAARITNHAAERFIKRHAPHMGLQEARAFLWKASQNAVRLKEKTPVGEFQWEIQDPYCVLVIKFDQNRPICVTVLPERHVSPHQQTLDEYEEFGSRPLASSKQDAYIRSILEKETEENTKKAPKTHIPKITKNTRDVIPPHPVVGGPAKWDLLEKNINEVRGADPDSATVLSVKHPGLQIHKNNALELELAIVRQREKTRRHMISERSQRVWVLFKSTMEFLRTKAMEDRDIAHFLAQLEREKMDDIRYTEEVLDMDAEDRKKASGE